LPGLFLKSDFGYVHDEMSSNLLQPSSSFAPPNNTNPIARSSYLSNVVSQTWNIEPQLSYQRKIGKGILNLLLGTTFQQTSRLSATYFAQGFSSDALIVNPVAASSFGISGYGQTLYKYNAIYSRIGYTWDEKYLLNVTARRDGSSAFGPGRQFGNFGAIGAGWIFSREKKIQDDLPWLSFGKLKASYGTTGNDQTIYYQYLSTYTANSTTYQGITGLAPTSLTNPEFGWETVKKLEGGIDLGFLKDRINLSVDYYRDRTDNQLVSYPLPNVAGFTSVQYNLPAVVQNTGLEVELNTINFRSNGFNWTSSANFTLPQNKLVSYPGIAGSSYANVYIVGQSLFIKRVYQYTGVNPQTGLYTFTTQNTNGIPSGVVDRYPTAPITQKYFGGFSNTFSYKNLSLDIFIEFRKQLGTNYLSSFAVPGAFSNNNSPTVVLNGWQQPGDVSNIQKLGTSSNSILQNTYSSLQNSNAIYSDASFIRVKNVALSYRLPVSWQQWAHAQNARIYMQAQNLFTITNYLGLDPETQGLILPPLRMITAGLSAQF